MAKNSGDGRCFVLPTCLQYSRPSSDEEGGLRKLPGTNLRNSQTGAVVYEPPQDPAEIEHLTANFLDYFNRLDSGAGFDPLVRMAILHYQFESIHPFYDGNGRMGRILNLLFLAHHGLLDLPVLYLSRFIVQTKMDYYNGLQAVRDEGAWEPWVLYCYVGLKKRHVRPLPKSRKSEN